MTEQASVTVYWRPGCGYCRVLRRGLDRAGLERTELDIWQDPAAAAIVRSYAQGNETVPTVLVGDRALVNPTAAEVIAAHDRLTGGPSVHGTSSTAGPPVEAPARRSGFSWAGMATTLAVCALWFGLASANPTTTYHLAPLLALLAWPLVTRERQGRDDWRPGLVAAGGATVLVALTTLVLVGRGSLDGPALLGPRCRSRDGDRLDDRARARAPPGTAARLA